MIPRAIIVVVGGVAIGIVAVGIIEIIVKVEMAFGILDAKCIRF
jgi:hypothetical protein